MGRDGWEQTKNILKDVYSTTAIFSSQSSTVLAEVAADPTPPFFLQPPLETWSASDPDATPGATAVVYALIPIPLTTLHRQPPSRSKRFLPQEHGESSSAVPDAGTHTVHNDCTSGGVGNERASHSHKDPTVQPRLVNRYAEG